MKSQISPNAYDIYIQYGVLTPAGIRGDATPLGFSENNSRTDWQIVAKLGMYLSIEPFYTFPENFKTVPTMTFDL